MLVAQLIQHHVLLEHLCMEPLVNVVIHSLKPIHIPVQLAEPSLEQPVMSHTPQTGNVLVDMDSLLLGVGVELVPTGRVLLVAQSFQVPHVV